MHGTQVRQVLYTLLPFLLILQTYAYIEQTATQTSYVQVFVTSVDSDPLSPADVNSNV